MRISLPELSLVLLVGPSGSGKSTFAKQHFRSTEIISSDFCRGILCDDENDQSITKEAFELLNAIVDKRLQLGRLTVVDATNVQPNARKPLVAIARQRHCLPVAIVFDTPEKVCRERNASRLDRDFGPHVVRNQLSQMKRGLKALKREGFRGIHHVDTSSEEPVEIVREPLWNNKKHLSGPFDIIGDVHGCYDELLSLLESLGYRVAAENGPPTISHPEGRQPVFVGDIVDRGPKVVDCLELVMNAVEDGAAFCVPGNHDIKLMRKLQGRDVQIAHGLAETLEQIEVRDAAFAERAAAFIDGLVSHLVFDDGKLVVAHAGLKEEMHGRGSRRVREFCLFGETTGETDEFGLPIRFNWAAEYQGRAKVVYGHTPVPEPQWLNNTINIDTGCVFGGKLTALRYPELDIVSITAARAYTEPARPFLPRPDHEEDLSLQHQHDQLLRIEDVAGKRFVETRLRGCITIREENSAAALETMSRFSADPRWLIYLPPTMSPCETSDRETYLEFPDQAFDYYKSRGVPRIVCQEKHMGSRAIAVVCKDEEAAARRFGVDDGRTGCVYSRTGRPFFEDQTVEAALLDRIRHAATRADLWSELGTDWLCLDCELMPWSWKARELLVSQYAATGAAAEAFATAAIDKLRLASQRVEGLDELVQRYEMKLAHARHFRDAYRQYCWSAESVDDLKLAPFHLLASEGRTHLDKDHLWHMELAHKLCQHDPVLLATNHKVIDTLDTDSWQQAIDWWLELTSTGGEGMVVKPFDFVARNSKGLLQPAVKCRGPEYLRIIYGMEYLAPENLKRLRARNLRTKRSLALREFALGAEALERFTRKEPLRRVHECVFAVLALESEPVDPRL